MAVIATVLFDSLRHELASLLTQKLRQSVSTHIVTGFATENGIRQIQGPILDNSSALKSFIVGAGTPDTFRAFDRMLSAGVSASALRVHLGHSLPSSKVKKRDRFRPMLHSKVYYMENVNGDATAIIGSHNVTGFALSGLNGEAAVMLEGSKSDPEFEKIRNHIDMAHAESIIYSVNDRNSLAWWTRQWINGLASIANSEQTGPENKKTIVILCQSEKISPKVEDVLYFEVPKELDELSSLSPDIHVYIFPNIPSTPLEALRLLKNAQGFRCNMVGLDINKGTAEVRADWFIAKSGRPIIKPTSKPFRPAPEIEMQQVQVKLNSVLKKQYDYLFDASDKWIAITDLEVATRIPEIVKKSTSPVQSNHLREKEWRLVKELRIDDSARNDKYSMALKKMSPDQGAYVLMSLRRSDVDVSGEDP